MNISNLDKLYSEASNSVRHYSKLILSLKNTTIAQGFSLLAAQSYFFQANEYVFSLLFGCFGILFTLTLYFIGRNLMGHYDVSLDAAQRIERELGIDQEVVGLWSAFEASSLRYRGNVFIRPITLHGHIILLLVAFIGIIVYDLVMVVGAV